MTSPTSSNTVFMEASRQFSFSLASFSFDYAFLILVFYLSTGRFDVWVVNFLSHASAKELVITAILTPCTLWWQDLLEFLSILFFLL